MLQKLGKHIDHYFPLSDKEWEELSSHFKIVTFQKGEHIYGDSKFITALYFIFQKVVKTLYLSSKANAQSHQKIGY